MPDSIEHLAAAVDEAMGSADLSAIPVRTLLAIESLVQLGTELQTRGMKLPEPPDLPPIPENVTPEQLLILNDGLSEWLNATSHVLSTAMTTAGMTHVRVHYVSSIGGKKMFAQIDLRHRV